jgi:hypothetical protein
MYIRTIVFKTNATRPEKMVTRFFPDGEALLVLHALILGPCRCLRVGGDNSELVGSECGFEPLYICRDCGFLRTFDTAGEVTAGSAAGASAIRRAHGGMRVCARAVCRNHAPRRRPFSPTAARMGPRCPRRRPRERVRRRRGLRGPRALGPALPARRASSACNASVASRGRAACQAWSCRWGRMVRVRRGARVCERTP